MEAQEFLKTVASIKSVESGAYVSVGGNLESLSELAPLVESLKVLGAKIEDFQVTSGDNGSYLCRPALILESGVVKLMFNPEAKYELPANSVVLDGSKLVVSQSKKAEPILIRKLKDAPPFLQYSEFDSYTGSVKALDYMRSIGADEVELELVDLEVTQAKGYTFYSGTFNDKNGKRVILSLNKNVGNKLNAALTLNKLASKPEPISLTLFTKEYTVNGESGTTIGVEFR